MAKSGAPEQDQEARGALKERALAYVDRVVERAEEAERQRAVAEALMETAQRERDEALAERDAMREKVNASLASASMLEMRREVSRSIDLRRTAEKAMGLLDGAQGMRAVPLTSVAAAWRVLDEGVKDWRKAK